MISRSRSGPTAHAMSIERTTSANNTVTCLYSAGFAGEDNRRTALTAELGSRRKISTASGARHTRMVSSLASLGWQNATATCDVAAG